jgi:hypothetical protein
MRLGAPIVTAIASLVLVTGATAEARGIPLVVDGVRVVAESTASGVVLSAQPGDATQETTIVDRAHQRSFSVIAIPYGTRAGVEDALPIARRGGAGEYRSALHDYRARTGQYALPAAVVGLFGAGVAGDVSVRHEDVGGFGAFSREALTAEWVTEAGGRIWIVRFVQYVGTGRSFDVMPEFNDELGRLGLTADPSALAKPTTVRKDTGASATPSPYDTASPGRATSFDPKPPRYSDLCDAQNFDATTQFHDWRNFLSASYEGVQACGPRPATGGPVVQASLADGTEPVVQFGAPELSLRWLYLAYGVPPYAGNGDQLYGRYDQTRGGKPLLAIAGSGNLDEVPQPGDVISYDTGGTGGHTAVVVASRVDGAGNGWVDVMEQNAAANGYARLPIVKHTVLSNYGGFITGWLTSHLRARRTR